MSWARILQDTSDGLIELEVSELDQFGEVLLPRGFGVNSFKRDDESNPEPEFRPPAQPHALGKKQPHSLCSVSVTPLTHAQIEEACVKVTANPGKYRLEPDVGSSAISFLSWADRRRLEELTMSTTERAWAVTVSVDDGIGGGFKRVPYTLALLKADLKRRVFKIVELDAAAATKPRVSFDSGGGRGLFAPPATSGGNGTMSGKAVNPAIGSYCGIITSNIETRLECTALPFDEVTTQVVMQMLATVDSQDWGTKISQFTLRSTEYSKQIACEHYFVAALLQAETTMGAHPMCGKEYDTESDLWGLVTTRVENLITPVAIQAWSCFADNQALLQLSS